MSVSFSVPTLMCGIVLLSDPGAKGSAPDWLVSGLRSPPFNSRRVDSIVPNVLTRRCRRRPSARIPQTVGRAYAPVAFITTGVQREHWITKCRQEIFMDAFMLVGAGVCRRQHRGCS